MQQITRPEKWTYFGGLLGQNMIYSFMSLYIMFFFTDLLHIPAQSVTVLVVVASLWDAINDPMMGMIADHTKTRLGKFRIYLLFGPILIAATTILCFTNFGGSPAGTVAVAAISYVLWGMSYTVCDIPIWAIASVISRDPNEKNTMITLGKIGGTVGTVIISVASVALLSLFGGERVSGAYTASAAIIAIIAAALMVAVGLVLKERIEPSKEMIPIRKNLQTISTNGPLKALMVTLLIINMVNNIRQVTQIYFAVYVWGSAGYVTYMGLSLVIGMVLGMAFTPRLIRQFDKKRIFIAACILGAVSSVLPFLLHSDPTTSLIFLGISFAATGVTTITSAAMLMDGIDYSESTLGFRGEGLVFSMNTFLNKLSSTIAKGVLGLAMVSMGYVENMVPTATVQTGFSAMIYVLPMVCFLLAVIPLLFYRLSEKQMCAIRAQLSQTESSQATRG